jgi:predicted permease
MVLLVGSGLMLRSFVRLNAADPGFSAPDVVTVGLSFGDDGDREAAATFYREVLERAAALPGVAAVGASGSVPLVTSDFSGGSFRIESEPREEGDIPPVAMYDAFTPGYLETMGIPLLAGRDVEWSDVASPAPVAWVNQSVAEDFLGGVEAALGKRITWGGTEVYAEIVGVVGDVRYSGVREEATPLGYIPLITADWSIPQIEFMTLAVEVPGDATSVVPALRDVVRELNPNVHITQVRTMADIRAESVADTSFTLILLGIASMMALLLGAVGLYGVISYAVAQRTQEIGVRMALGADRQRVQKMVVRQGLGVTAVGLVLGVVGAFALSRLLKTLLFEVEATDPLTFVVVPVVLAAVSTAAAWLPARRASRVDPARALRGK